MQFNSSYDTLLLLSLVNNVTLYTNAVSEVTLLISLQQKNGHGHDY